MEIKHNDSVKLSAMKAITPVLNTSRIIVLNYVLILTLLIMTPAAMHVLKEVLTPAPVLGLNAIILVIPKLNGLVRMAHFVILLGKIASIPAIIAPARPPSLLMQILSRAIIMLVIPPVFLYVVAPVALDLALPAILAAITNSIRNKIERCKF